MLRYMLQLLFHLVILSMFYLAGVFIQNVFSIPFPGSLIGMVLLLLGLITKTVSAKYVDAGATFLLRHISLLFIPIITGVVTFPMLFTYQGLQLLFICLISTCLVILLSGLVSQGLVKKKEGSL